MQESVVTRVQQRGIEAATLLDLFSIALSRHEEDVENSVTPCGQLIRTMGSLQNLGLLTLDELRKPTGLERFEVLRVQCAIELGRRSKNVGRGETYDLSNPEAVYTYLHDLRGQKKEIFVALLLDSKNQLIRRADVHIGTVNMSVVGAREVFREAVRDGATSIIVAHNHPSGDPEPSPEDVLVTRNLRKAGELLDIELLDHVVVAERGYRSLRRMGCF